MAKRFIEIDEVAQKLNMSVSDVEDLISQGRLDQFRDGDAAYCKTEDVDRLAGELSGAIPVAEQGTGTGSDQAALSDLGFGGDTGASADATFYMTPDSGTFDIAGASSIESAADGLGDFGSLDDGQSIFDSDEVVEADNNAQTRITSSDSQFSVEDDEEELVLEAVGSGSGLLDLTRESDDTSLGAELLEEIYPSSATGVGNDANASMTGFGVGAGAAGQTGFGAAGQTGFGVAASQSMSMTPSGMAGMFDSTPGTTGDPSFQGDQSQGSAVAVGIAVDAAPEIVYQREPIDYPGSGLALGALIPVFGVVILGLILVAFTLLGYEDSMMTDLAKFMQLVEGGAPHVSYGALVFIAAWVVPAFLMGGVFWFFGRRLVR